MAPPRSGRSRPHGRDPWGGRPTGQDTGFGPGNRAGATAPGCGEGLSYQRRGLGREGARCSPAAAGRRAPRGRRRGAGGGARHGGARSRAHPRARWRRRWRWCQDCARRARARRRARRVGERSRRDRSRRRSRAPKTMSQPERRSSSAVRPWARLSTGRAGQTMSRGAWLRATTRPAASATRPEMPSPFWGRGSPRDRRAPADPVRRRADRGRRGFGRARPHAPTERRSGSARPAEPRSRRGRAAARARRASDHMAWAARCRGCLPG
jgi:hypothetical protein